MIGDREAVGLVAQALHQEEGLAGAGQDHRVLVAGQPDLLEPLGDAGQGDVGDAEVVEGLLGGGDLRGPAVDQDQRGRVGEAPRLLLGLRGRFEVVAQATGDHVVHGGGVVAGGGPGDRVAAVLALLGQAVLEDHLGADDVRALRVGDVEALDAQRRLGEVEGLAEVLERLGAGGEVAGAAQPMQPQRLLGVGGDGAQQVLLLAALGDAHLHGVVDELLEQVPVGGLDGHQHLPGRGTLGVEGGHGALDEGRRVGLVEDLGGPAALSADAAAAHVEDLDGGLQLVLGDADEVRVGGVGEHDGVLGHHGVQGLQVVAQARRGLVVHRGGGLPHPLLDAAGVGAGVAGHEVRELLGQAPVVLDGDLPRAGRGALADEAQQAGAPRALGAAVHPGAAGAHREHPQHQVHRLPDRADLRVGAEGAVALGAGAAGDLRPRHLLPHRQHQVRVGLVVAELDVEPRVVLLDPGVLEGEGLHLGADHGPLDPVRGGDHAPGALVQHREVLEVVREPLAQVLGLADVDDSACGVAESVDAGTRRNRSRRRTVARRICHGRQLRHLG